MYDSEADRFFISQFNISGGNGLLVAVSTGPDPVNDGWYTYEFPVSGFPSLLILPFSLTSKATAFALLTEVVFRFTL